MAVSTLVPKPLDNTTPLNVVTDEKVEFISTMSSPMANSHEKNTSYPSPSYNSYIPSQHSPVTGRQRHPRRASLVANRTWKNPNKKENSERNGNGSVGSSNKSFGVTPL